ncbi:uncharacterized protein METZ01_LOCUS405799, partial [marine metagenome]
MGTNFTVDNYIKNHNDVMASLNQGEIEFAINLIVKTWESDQQIVTCGNGGSANTTSHYITDWNKMSHLATGKQFKGICLSDNTGLITAYANDLSYDDIYSEQVKNLMKEGDLLIIVSGSGNSENVVRAIDVANDLGCETLAICGYDGGKVKKIAKHSLH